MTTLKPNSSSATYPPSRQYLLEQYQRVRQCSEQLCQPLVAEDYVIQSMPDVSPTKWHLAHMSWFFETFLLQNALPGYKPLHPQYAYLFNSYYNSLGSRHCRPKRGLISRPTVQETYAYRHYVDEHVHALLEQTDEGKLAELAPIMTLGLHHEQQHQELLLTDIKHVLSCNPLYPVYSHCESRPAATVPQIKWLTFSEGIYKIGHEGSAFAFDNESPKHSRFLQAFQMASRPVTNGEYLGFIEAGGYENPLLWLAEGWNTVCAEDWHAPLYWGKNDGQWQTITLSGLRNLGLSEPVCHVSYYEADAFARWADSRLPTEAEWEVAAQTVPVAGNFVESGLYHPVPLEESSTNEEPCQMYGDVWEWTQSPYTPYPGFRPSAGAVGEYNGKFMCNQYVLRGGSCATPQSHVRLTYRNFFHPHAQWQFMGIRLAKDI